MAAMLLLRAILSCSLSRSRRVARLCFKGCGGDMVAVYVRTSQSNDVIPLIRTSYLCSVCNLCCFRGLHLFRKVVEPRAAMSCAQGPTITYVLPKIYCVFIFSSITQIEKINTQLKKTNSPWLWSDPVGARRLRG